MQYTFTKEPKEKAGRSYVKYSVLKESNAIGSAILRTRKGLLTILDFHIDPEFRSKGLGRLLMQKIIEDNTGSQIHLRPRPYKDKPINKEGLKKFYESFGFREFGDEGRMVLSL